MGVYISRDVLFFSPFFPTYRLFSNGFQMETYPRTKNINGCACGRRRNLYSRYIVDDVQREKEKGQSCVFIFLKYRLVDKFVSRTRANRIKPTKAIAATLKKRKRDLAEGKLLSTLDMNARAVFYLFAEQRWTTRETYTCRCRYTTT